MADGTSQECDPRWRKIPELHDVEFARADSAYSDATKRAWKLGSTWLALVCFVAIIALGMLIEHILSNALRARKTSFWILILVRLAISAAQLLGALVAFNHLRLAALRRCVRAELGTHCRACDYDLRGTTDLPYPQVARCPECGTAIPRNVHRPRIV